MIRLRVAGVTIDAHFSHLLLCAFVAYGLVGFDAGADGWPQEILRRPSHPAHTVTLLGVGLAWTCLVSLSVVVHELGHALAARVLGGRPAISLIGLGGRTSAGLEQLEWWEDVLFTLAGPAAGLAFAVTMGLAAFFARGLGAGGLVYFSKGLFFANVAWTVLNLVPLTGLDGGAVVSAVLQRVFGRVGFLLAQVVSLGVAALMVIAAGVTGQPVLAVLLGLIGFRTMANIAAYRRGELPAGAQPNPLRTLLERAEALYRERKLDEASIIAAGLVESAHAGAALRSRAHLLLGWVALKQGRGRAALDHFSQVQGLPVPPQALAAGFSLIGDDERALPLWQRAVAETKDDVVRVELAGTLARLGRVAELANLGVELSAAHQAAERVFALRGDFVAAARSAEAAFEVGRTPPLAYAAACEWALAHRTDDAMRLLRAASEGGYRDGDAARRDPDLKDLRGRPDFEAWLAGLSRSS